MLRLIVSCLLMCSVCGATALAASSKAAALRQSNALTAYSPPEKFLSGNFVADEMNPAVIFGTVKEFVAGRSCPTSWLIEEGEKIRLASPKDPAAFAEYTLYLEEDCPDAVAYFVFVDQSGFTPKQWIDWRQQFHKSKAEPEYGATKVRFEQALQDGVAVAGELRFLMKNGELLPARPEDALRGELRFAPLYDLNQNKKLAK